MVPWLGQRHLLILVKRPCFFQLAMPTETISNLDISGSLLRHTINMEQLCHFLVRGWLVRYLVYALRQSLFCLFLLILECNDATIIMDYNSQPTKRVYSAQGVLEGETCSSTDDSNTHHWRGIQNHLGDVNGTVSGIGFILDLGKKTAIVGYQIKNDNQLPDNTRCKVLQLRLCQQQLMLVVIAVELKILRSWCLMICPIGHKVWLELWTN